MKSVENATEMETVASEKNPINNKKEKAGKNIYSFQGWVSTGSAWFRSAKEKTYTTFELVKKDLTEFGDVVANEASALANTTVESVRQQAYNLQQIMNLEGENNEQNKEEREKVESTTNEIERSSSTYAIEWASRLSSLPTITDNSWIKTIVDTVKNIAQENTADGEDEFTESIYPQIKSTGRSCLAHHILYEIQTNPDTYMKIPEGDKELFKMWCDDFKLIDYDGEINALLANCPRMRALYQEMVPEKIENVVFWARYFYKVYQMELLVRCKFDAEKQLSQDDENGTIQRQKRMTNFGEKSSNRIESCLNVDTELTQSQSSLDRRSAIDESWSLCSSTNVDIQELHDENGPQTPKADSNNSSNKSDGWINWDE
ncbi:BSD domain protein [Onchocerca flexuosa]|uniref:BSD domain protein n=1 Tax=Onchocerca flexuosa TaxID=387005 RepID=A0A238BWV3_9BILA|nr:BSD domain protein [Onchocerca flexuosa]